MENSPVLRRFFRWVETTQRVKYDLSNCQNYLYYELFVLNSPPNPVTVDKQSDQYSTNLHFPLWEGGGGLPNKLWYRFSSYSIQNSWEHPRWNLLTMVVQSGLPSCYEWRCVLDCLERENVPDASCGKSPTIHSASLGDVLTSPACLTWYVKLLY